MAAKSVMLRVYLDSHSKQAVSASVNLALEALDSQLGLEKPTAGTFTDKLDGLYLLAISN